jgi:SP family sugar:H+ symporter-like MFS transporter
MTRRDQWHARGWRPPFDLGKVGIGINVGAILVGSSIGAFAPGAG